jgi:hypothetical protein
MYKLSCVPSKRFHQLLALITLAFIPISCKLVSSEPHQYINPAFTFDYPSDWQTMEELWGFQQLDKNYYDLEFQEIVMVTSVQKKGEFGAYFAVASRVLPDGSTIESVFHNTYSQIHNEIRVASETTINLNGISALVKNYERPWGEPWWQFQDVWLENDGTIYLLSFHCVGSIEKYQEDLNFILNSFSFK